MKFNFYNKKIMILYGLILMLLFGLTYVVFGYQVAEDTKVYEAFRGDVPPLYPLFLLFCRSVFGYLYYDAVVIIQIVFAVTVATFSLDRFRELFDLNVKNSIIFGGIFFLYFQIPIDGYPCFKFLSILTEGLAYPLYLLLFTFIISAVIGKSFKNWVLGVVTTVLLYAVRNQMAVCFVVILVAAIPLCFSKKKKIFNFLLCILTVISSFIFLQMVKSIYYEKVGGELVNDNQISYAFIPGVLYVSDESDIVLFKDVDERCIYQNIISTVNDNHINYFYSQDGIVGRMYHYGNNRDSIYPIIDEAINDYYVENNISEYADRMMLKGRIMNDMVIILIKDNWREWLYTYFSLCIGGAVRTIAGSPSHLSMVLYSIVIYSLFLILILRFRKNRELFWLGVMAFLMIMGNITGTCLVIMPLFRYMFYGFVIMYGTLYIMIIQLAKEHKKELVNEKVDHCSCI